MRAGLFVCVYDCTNLFKCISLCVSVQADGVAAISQDGSKNRADSSQEHLTKTLSLLSILQHTPSRSPSSNRFASLLAESNYRKTGIASAAANSSHQRRASGPGCQVTRQNTRTTLTHERLICTSVVTAVLLVSHN